MTEYLSEAIILEKMPNGDTDSRVALYTKRYGKIVAKAKSVRKITSKLSAHLEPGTIARVRVVEKNGPQIVDALKQGKCDVVPHHLAQVSALLGEFEPDLQLWHMLLAKQFSWRDILSVLGWNPLHAQCASCHKGDIGFFDTRSQEFFCAECVLKKSAHTVLLDIREHGR